VANVVVYSCPIRRWWSMMQSSTVHCPLSTVQVCRIPTLASITCEYDPFPDRQMRSHEVQSHGGSLANQTVLFMFTNLAYKLSCFIFCGILAGWVSLILPKTGWNDHLHVSNKHTSRHFMICKNWFTLYLC
jgi:hypothetical protein